MRTRPRTTLILSRETLRRLDPRQLGRVRGGTETELPTTSEGCVLPTYTTCDTEACDTILLCASRDDNVCAIKSKNGTRCY